MVQIKLRNDQFVSWPLILDPDFGWAVLLDCAGIVEKVILKHLWTFERKNTVMESPLTSYFVNLCPH